MLVGAVLLFEGKEQTLSLDVYSVVRLKDARDKHFFLRQQIAQGVNSGSERKKEKCQRKEAVQEEIAKGEVHPLSVEAVALDCLEDVRKIGKQNTCSGLVAWYTRNEADFIILAPMTVTQKTNRWITKYLLARLPVKAFPSRSKLYTE